VIPNGTKLFAEPREVIKYQEIEGSHARGLDLSKPPREVMQVCEPGTGRKLFQEPRMWQKLVEEQRVVRREGRREPEEGLEVRRNLFQQPREVIKYQDVQGSHPTPFYPATARQVSPTFRSTLFAE
jgi:hypothetical protein